MPRAPEPLRPDHVLANFDCGTPALNAWLQRRAAANQASGASRTFVACEGGRVVGFGSVRRMLERYEKILRRAGSTAEAEAA